VRKEDQQKINTFGVIHRSLEELKEDRKKIEEDLNALEDAEQELMMAGDSDTFMIKLGSSYVNVDEDRFNEFMEKRKAELDARMVELEKENGALEEQRDTLKQSLKSRFGNTINLDA